MNKFDNESKKVIHFGFQVGLIIKAFNGFMELLFGLLVLYFPTVISQAVRLIVGGELSEDPKDVVVGFILNWTEYGLSGIRMLVGVYLLIIGIAKIGFVIALFKKKLKAYIVYEWILAAFVVYQVYRFIILREMFVFWLTLVDLSVMVFVYLEYLRLKRKI